MECRRRGIVQGDAKGTMAGVGGRGVVGHLATCLVGCVGWLRGVWWLSSWACGF